MFLHHFVCSVHFPTVQKHTGFETIPHLYWKNDKGVEPANSFQPAFSGYSSVIGSAKASWSLLEAFVKPSQRVTDSLNNDKSPEFQQTLGNDTHL